MKTFASRRLRHLAITAAAAAALLGAHTVYAASLVGTAILSGWALFLSLVVLAGFNVRKKLPFLPLGTAAAWLQFHAYLGLVSACLLLLHIGFRVPDGFLERSLAGLYVLVAGSGVAGLLLSRILPPRLTRHGEDIVFERIPALRARLRRQAEELVIRSVTETGAETLAAFHSRRLIHFFSGPRNLWSHIVESRRPLHALASEMADLDRYLDPREREISAGLADLVTAKDNLDYQHAVQSVLKSWLFVHVPLTYCLLILSIVHGLLAHAFVA